MYNLLRAGFTRLWKNKYFWLCTAAMLAMGILSTNTAYWEHESYPLNYGIDNVLFNGVAAAFVLGAVFVGFFVGTDYSDGTIRNKLIIGSKRWAVYLSNLLVCEVGTVIMTAAAMLPVLAVGFPLLSDTIRRTPGELAVNALICLACLTALNAIFVLLAMLVTNRSATLTLSLLLSLALLIIGSIAYNKLLEPEYLTNQVVTYVDEDGNLQQVTPQGEKNPNYVSGAARSAYQFVYDFTPGGQIVQVSDMNLNSPGTLALYDLAIFGIATAVGLVLFVRKDLK